MAYDPENPQKIHDMLDRIGVPEAQYGALDGVLVRLGILEDDLEHLATNYHDAKPYGNYRSESEDRSRINRRTELERIENFEVAVAYAARGEDESAANLLFHAVRHTSEHYDRYDSPEELTQSWTIGPEANLLAQELLGKIKEDLAQNPIQI